MPLNKKKFEDIDCASKDKKMSFDIPRNEDVPRFRIGKITLDDKYCGGKKSPLCWRYDSRTEACFLASST